MNKINKNQEELITDFIRWSHIWMNQRKYPKITEIKLDDGNVFEGRKGIQHFRMILSDIRASGQYNTHEKDFLRLVRKWFKKECKNQWGKEYKDILIEKYKKQKI